MNKSDFSVDQDLSNSTFECLMAKEQMNSRNGR